MVSTRTDLRPAARAVITALERHKASLTQALLLNQRIGVNDDLLEDAAAADTPIGKAAAAFLDARQALNSAIAAERRRTTDEVNELALPFLTELFGAQVPGSVTLPSDTSRGTITEHVASLEGLSVRGEEISGVVRTTSDGGRCGDSRSFFTRGSMVFFCDHVSI